MLTSLHGQHSLRSTVRLDTLFSVVLSLFTENRLSLPIAVTLFPVTMPISLDIPRVFCLSLICHFVGLVLVILLAESLKNAQHVCRKTRKCAVLWGKECELKVADNDGADKASSLEIGVTRKRRVVCSGSGKVLEASHHPLMAHLILWKTQIHLNGSRLTWELCWRDPPNTTLSQIQLQRHRGGSNSSPRESGYI